jgi:uncharacterized GH25 family protein
VNGSNVRRTIVLTTLLLLVAVGGLAAHDLFLKLDSYFVAPGASLTVRVLNGTFSKSEKAVAKDRLRDISVVTPSGRARLDTAAWADRGDTSILTVPTREPGTYVIGASLRPRELTLAAKAFNSYLASDGLPDVLAARRKDGELDRPARERYSKHVKALVQVGERRSDDYRTALGYPAELIPLDNPYALKEGGVLRVRAAVEGEPVANQVVIAGGRTTSGGRIAQRTVRTDSTGVARVPLLMRGVWFVKFIRMQRVAGDSTVDYESKWATLTFGVR